ncbi:hypothetical protein [Solibacillus isronensis]|uniref:hypothetical protein n=1 Tax=Solibacillus isronensis TaxID=412383 RepID=UPI0039A065A1
MAWQQVAQISTLHLEGYSLEEASVRFMSGALYVQGYYAGSIYTSLPFPTAYSTVGSYDNTKYVYRVKVERNYGSRTYYMNFAPNNNYSDQVFVKIPISATHGDTLIFTLERDNKDTAPTTPSSISASGTFETGKSVTVSWGASTDADGDAITYWVQASRNGGSYTAVQSGTTARSFVYTIPSGTTSLRFKVYAKANNVNSGERESTTYTVTTNTAPTTPGVFTSPASGTVLKGGETITLRWGASADVDGNAITYELEYSPNSGTSWGAIPSVTTTSRTFSLNNSDTKIRFRVRAKDSVGAVSAWQTTGDFTITHNAAPTLTLSTTDAQTLYENDIFAINGSATDTDSGNVLSVKYSIDGGTARAIIANVSTGSAMSYAKNLTYKSGILYDGATAITSALSEGSQHTLKVWAEDDKGGKSSEITRSFYVVPNRAATLTLDAFVTRTGLINTDVVNISGKVADLDNGNVIVKYKIGNGAFVQVFNNTVGATPTPFNFNVLLADLVDGDNQITIQAVDAYNAITQQVLTIRKNKNEVPMLEAVTYYEITPPNGASDGLQLYIEREVGDLVVAADVFMGAPGQSEVFVPMTLASTANLTNGNAEDTFSYEHGSDASKIVVRIKMTRSSGASNKAIKKISGVLT